MVIVNINDIIFMSEKNICTYTSTVNQIHVIVIYLTITNHILFELCPAIINFFMFIPNCILFLLVL